MLSDEHTYCTDNVHKGPPWKEGGPLFLRRIFVNYHPDVGKSFTCYMYRCEGDYYLLREFQKEMEAPFNAYSPTVESYGAAAWNAARPLRPKVDLGQFFAELRDLPSMFKAKLRYFKDIGSAYLNSKFGWEPFLRDILDWYETASEIDKTIAFARKNNGKWLVRKGTLYDNSDTVTTTQTVPIWPALPTSLWPSGSAPPCDVRTVTSDKVWYKARMKYFIPDLQWDSAKSVWSSKLLRHLYGLEITPSLCWELMPWSWFADWHLGFGNLLANFSNNLYDHVVAKYAYVMRHRKVTRTYKFFSPIRVDQECTMVPSEQLAIQTVVGIECKERAGASPFGFGRLESEYSPTQVAILAALGVSRLH